MQLSLMRRNDESSHLWLINVVCSGGLKGEIPHFGNFGRHLHPSYICTNLANIITNVLV